MGEYAMKPRIVLLALMISLPTLSYSETYHEIILKNGVIVRGIIVGQEDQDTIEIKLKDGRSVFYKTADILNIQVKEELVFNVERSKHRKNTALALSLIPPIITPIHGLGQFYNGDTDKGIFFLAAGLVGASVIYSGYRSEIDKEGSGKRKITIGAVILLGSWILSSLDAYDSAR